MDTEFGAFRSCVKLMKWDHTAKNVKFEFTENLQLEHLLHMHFPPCKILIRLERGEEHDEKLPSL